MWCHGTDGSELLKLWRLVARAQGRNHMTANGKQGGQSAPSADGHRASHPARSGNQRTGHHKPDPGRGDTAPEAGREGFRGQTPPPFPPPGRSKWTYIEQPEQVAHVAQLASAADVVAIDAEFVQVRTRGPNDPPHRLALLQLATMPSSEGAFVVDALRIADLRPLEQSFADPRILKLFHGIGADARVLATRGLVARHTLDLEAVSRSIFGQSESGLQSMLLRACGVRLDKTLQRSDWTRRPLTPAMLAYAARDAEMTLVLYNWLATHYPWAIELHEVAGDEAEPLVAAWVQPFLSGSRPQRAEWAVAAAGLEGDKATQAADLRAALAAVRLPPQRARVIRLTSDLDLSEVAPDLKPLLSAPAAEERSSAARALGRLHDRSAETALRALLDDPVRDVREAAEVALDHVSGKAPPRPVSRARQSAAGTWTVGDGDESPNAPTGWQAELRARFGSHQPPAEQDDAAGDEFDQASVEGGVDSSDE